MLSDDAMIIVNVGLLVRLLLLLCERLSVLLDVTQSLLAVFSVMQLLAKSLVTYSIGFFFILLQFLCFATEPPSLVSIARVLWRM